MKEHTITLQVRAEHSEDLLIALGEDDRVTAITMKVADGRYVLPVRKKARHKEATT